MHIFEQEKIDGLADLMSTSASISYACVAEPCSLTYKKPPKIKSIASYSDEDLYYVQSILVTSSWNKNDDIFDKTEVWKAKHTPEHKPTNLEHNEDIIIGHIISNWPITEDGDLIDENTPIQDLPNKFHILTGSVIYRGFSNPELKERSENLISQIQAGTKYVSMECFFKGFDYGVLNTQTNEYKVLARNEETAYLTKFLRSYGGMGQHQDYKIGRVLRNITFTGKGFVDRPANIDSIIFIKNLFPETNKDNIEEKNSEMVQSGVFISQSNINSEKLIMSSDNQETEMQKTEVENVNVEFTALSSEVAELKLVKEKLEADLSDLAQTKESEITALKEEAANKTKEMEEEKKQMEEEKKKMKAELDAALEAIAGYKTKEAEMEKKAKTMKRKASLIEQGVDAEIAANIIEKFDSMEDEAFEAMTVIFAGKMPPWLDKSKKDETKEDEKDMKAKKKASEENSDPAVLETVEIAEEVNLGVGSAIESEVDSTRAALVDFVRSKIGKKVK
jgi:hypothetical protein